MSQFRKSLNPRSGINRRQLLQYGSLALGASLLKACSNNSPATSSTSAANKQLEKVSFGTNWYAQAEHGGFYQAIAQGIYQDYGLDVTIKMGGPQINGTQLLMGGAIDFFMGHGGEAIRAIQEGIPKVTVAAIFQKDPQILMAHPGVGNDSLEQLKGKPILVSSAANTTYWPLLKSKYGFTDEQKRPYNFNLGPFLIDKTAAQQGYLSSEPLKAKQEGGFEPVVFLLADYGYSPYATTIEATQELVQKNPDLVQRFVDASIKGWYSYLVDPAPANALIKRDNPNMTDELLTYGVAKIKEYGIVTSGDAEQLGIGAMSDQRWQEFFDLMAGAKVFDPQVNYREAYTLRFVNKGVQAYQV